MNPGYPRKVRMVYYGCRLISSQYGKLKKIYTIWICAAPPKYLQNRIIGYSIQPYEIVGDKNDGNNAQDIMRFITVYLGEEDGDKNGLLRLLEVLLDAKKDHAEKKRILQDEYNIEMTSKFDEEVMEMCNLSDGVWNKGYNEGVESGIVQGMAQGIAQGMAQGIAQGIAQNKLEMIRNLMRSLGFSADKAMETLCIPKNEWEQYRPSLQS